MYNLLISKVVIIVSDSHCECRIVNFAILVAKQIKNINLSNLIFFIKSKNIHLNDIHSQTFLFIICFYIHN